MARLIAVEDLAVGSVEEAAAAIAELRGDPARHAAAARELAEEPFDAERLLGDALELAGIARRSAA